MATGIRCLGGAPQSLQSRRGEAHLAGPGSPAGERSALLKMLVRLPLCGPGPQHRRLGAGAGLASGVLSLPASVPEAAPAEKTV